MGTVHIISGDGNSYGAVVDSSGNLKVALSATPTIDIGDVNTVAPQGTFTAQSGAMTAGGTSQTMMAANSSRKYLLIQNPATLTGQNIAAAESLFIRFGASAAGVNNGTSFEILPGGAFESAGAFVSTEAVQVNATTTAHKWVSVEG
jgi:hypothetical protein